MKQNAIVARERRGLCAILAVIVLCATNIFYREKESGVDVINRDCIPLIGIGLNSDLSCEGVKMDLKFKGNFRGVKLFICIGLFFLWRNFGHNHEWGNSNHS
ncbi:MAG: hypothetical protein ACI39T_08670 [Candidatus Cryptobacteroides sp.]